ncbi:MAG: thiamine pyrophosphate-binding protein [Desulfobacterales bacterium]|jgi:acetolactate synthase-1/2/3 large subunit
MKHLEALASQIAAQGVSHTFGIPGSGPSLFLLDALEKQGVQFHLTHFEGSAALMAGAIGKLSGSSGVAISIKGPGLTNMLPGLAACSLDAFPVVSVSEAYLPDTPLENAHKRLDHNKLLAAIVKFQCGLSLKGPRFAELTQRAESEVPGVVHLNIAATPYQEDLLEDENQIEKSDDAQWAQAERLLRQSNHPLIIAGTLATRKSWCKKLNALSLPIFSTAAAKGAVDENLLHAAGVFTGVGGPLAPEKKLIPQADLIIAIGLRHNEVLAVKPFDCPTILIDPLGEAQSFGFKFDSTIEGSPLQIEALLDQLAEKQWGLDMVDAARQRLNKKLEASSFLPAAVYRCISAHFRNEARLVLDTGDFCTIAEHAWAVARPDLYLACGQGRYMGVAIPLGIGAAIYDPGVPTVVFTGDGGIGMFVSEIKLAVQHKLPLLVVLISDSHLGTIRGSALQKGLTQHATAIYQPSWVKAIAGFDLPVARAETIDQVEKSLSSWDQKGPLFLEVPFDADKYQRMTEGIR